MEPNSVRALSESLNKAFPYAHISIRRIAAGEVDSDFLEMLRHVRALRDELVCKHLGSFLYYGIRKEDIGVIDDYIQFLAPYKNGGGLWEKIDEEQRQSVLEWLLYVRDFKLFSPWREDDLRVAIVWWRTFTTKNEKTSTTTLLPSLLDISPTGGLDLDERTAVEHFLGKDLDQAEALFRDNAFHYLEDLGWMGPKAFVFYYKAFRNYLRKDKEARSIEVAACFAGAVKCQMEYNPAEIQMLRKELVEDLRFCLYHSDDFELDLDPCGHTRDVMNKAIETLES